MEPKSSGYLLMSFSEEVKTDQKGLGYASPHPQPTHLSCHQTSKSTMA